jgi:hypothetical protein
MRAIVFHNLGQLAEYHQGGPFNLAPVLFPGFNGFSGHFKSEPEYFSVFIVPVADPLDPIWREFYY